ncbi:MAG: cupredoxin domain-containing protein [Actinomycetota bacterium]
MRVANASRVLRRAALLLACTSAFAACSGGPGTKAIEVAMHYSRFTPAAIEVAAGTTVEFEIVNGDPIAHEFIIGSEAVQQRHELGNAGEQHNGPGEASIPANATVRISYMFREAGTLIYACHVPGHYAYGMRGTVKVT